MLRHSCRSRHPRCGVVLLSVLVVVVVLSLAAYQYSEWMMAEYRAVDGAQRAAQSEATALSGVHYAAALLTSGNQVLSNPFDNPGAFQGIEVPGASKSGRVTR